MSKDITLMGASYSAVPAVMLPQTGGGTATFTDVTDTTATAADVAQGKQFYNAAGVLTNGTASGGGGGSSWTKVGEGTYAVSTTSTTATNIDTLATGHSELWTSDKWVYVRVRDTAGKRNGYFYGSDRFFYNVNPVNHTSTTSIVTAISIYTRCNNNGTFTVMTNTSSTGYGVYADTIDSAGNVRVRSRYNATTANATLTIDGTYKVEVYLLDMPDGIPVFG